ncbi:MAG: nucleotidyltransferase domain-containing protein [Ekhidna sp.]|uniref:nucleotidyltransferase family protein n=1 Tax=Ekhidna sp. TaxID=2608089 RepID=UPI0032EFFE11
MAYITDYISSHDPRTFYAKLKKEKVGALYAFGSGLRSETPNDIDLLIEVENEDPLERGESLLNLWDYFESYFKKKVDLLTPNSLKNPYIKEEIEKTKKLIYAKEQQGVFT